MAARRLIVFDHGNQLGKAPSHELFEAVTIERKAGVEVPRAFEHYEIGFDRTRIEAKGVTVTEKF